MTYLTAIERTHDNPLTGKAGYRVLFESFEVDPAQWKRVEWQRHWYLLTDRPYRTGTFINPRKALGV